MARTWQILYPRIRYEGLLALSACSHSGIVNVLHYVCNLTEGLPIYGVAGGFHLSGKAFESIIPETVDATKWCHSERSEESPIPPTPYWNWCF